MIKKLYSGLVLLVILAILISCNNSIKPQDKVNLSKLNDTVLLIQTYNFNRFGHDAVQYVNENSSDKEFKEVLSKLESFQRDSQKKVDSLSHIKGILFPDKLPNELKKSIQQIKNKKTGLMEQEFVEQLEKQMINQINFLETFSKKSENNETTTLAILLLSRTQNELELLNNLRLKLATP